MPASHAARQVLEYLLQKLTLVGVLCFIQPGSLEQLLIGLIVCFIYMAIVSWLQPFGSKLDNVLVCVTQFSLFISMLTAVIIEHGASSVPPTVESILIVSAFVPATLGFVLAALVVVQELGGFRGLNFAFSAGWTPATDAAFRPRRASCARMDMDNAPTTELTDGGSREADEGALAA